MPTNEKKPTRLLHFYATEEEAQQIEENIEKMMITPHGRIRRGDAITRILLGKPSKIREVKE